MISDILPVHPIYLDYNASTPIDPAVAAAARPASGRSATPQAPTCWKDKHHAGMHQRLTTPLARAEVSIADAAVVRLRSN